MSLECCNCSQRQFSFTHQFTFLSWQSQYVWCRLLKEIYFGRLTGNLRMNLYPIQIHFSILTGKSFSVVALIFTFSSALDSLLYIRQLWNQIFTDWGYHAAYQNEWFYWLQITSIDKGQICITDISIDACWLRNDVSFRQSVQSLGDEHLYCMKLGITKWIQNKNRISNMSLWYLCV